MKLWKRTVAAVLSLCLLGSLTACGNKGLTEKDAETYVSGLLNAAYLGTYDKGYIDLVEDMTESDAKKMHDQNVSDEAEILLDYFLVEYPDDNLTQRSQELIEEIYSHAKFTVGEASKTKDGDFVVEVTVSPIEILDQITDDDFFDALETSGYVDAETDEETAKADAIYGGLMLDKLESLIPQLDYGEDQSIMLHLKLDDDGYYNLVDTGIQKVDEVIIDYYGYYVK